MSSSHFNNWSPRIPIDLHHHRSASPASPAATAAAAASAAAPNTTTAASAPKAAMSQPHPQVPAQVGPHTPTGTPAVSMPPPPAKDKAPLRPARPFSSGSFTSPAFTIRDSVSGGVLSSRSFTANSSSDLSSTGKQTGANAKPADPPSVFRSNSGGNTSSSSSSSKIMQPPPEKMRPIYHPFSNMGGFVQPSRSLSYAGTPNTRLGNLTGVSSSTTFNDQNSHLASIRKSPSLGKPAKKGIKSKLRKLRQKQGSSSREAELNAFITSGESDSEAAFDPEPDTFFNSGGIAHRFIPSASTSNSKSLKLTRPKLPHQGASLPPHPPHRHNTSNSISFAYGGKSGGASGGEHGSETQKDSSAVRFKDLFKNVGQYSAGAMLSPSNTISEHHGVSAAGGVSKPLQSRSTFPLFGDFLSGDDQPAATTKFRLTGPGRRKRRFTKKSHSAGGGMLATSRSAAATDDEDSGASRSGTHRTPHHHQSHHNFLHHLHRRHRNRTIGEDARPQAASLWKQEQVEPQERPISSTLRDARQANTDPNVLLAELEPLPAQFLCDFAALSSRGTHGPHPHPPLPQVPLVTHITPASTAGSGLVALFSPPSATTTATAGTALGNQQNTGAQPRPLTGCPEAIVTKTFLFQSYQNSQFQGHYYLFRVIGDRVEYKRLPLTLKQPCSQYFHKAYVTYRSFDQKYKDLKEDRERRQVTGPFWSKPSGSEIPPLRHGSSDSHTATLSTTAGVKKQNTGGMQRTNSENDIAKSSIAWDQIRQGQEAAAAQASLQALEDAQSSRKTGYQDQRYNPESSSNAIVRSMVGVRDRSKSVDVRQWSHLLHGTGQTVTPPSQRPQSYHIRKRSWASIREQHRLELEQQRAAEERHWNEMERNYREDFRQATYGLELYLAEIVKGSAEFERFDTAFNVTIDENRRGDTAVFSIENGDKTNKMWLESPSAKLKYEFLNWIALTCMDHGEPVPAPVVDASEAHRRESHLDAFMGPMSAKGRPEEDVEDADLLFEFIDIRLLQQEERLQELRKSIQGIMSQLQDCLDGLDNVDENAKKLMTTMIRAIDSQEVQLALRPSPSTGLTLAQTVEWKLKDVNQRIVICTRIMGAARFNLNRLRYEIELEQRSIRLFRQYKIIIGVVTLSLVFLVWFLYHSRASALAPQPASPLFSGPVNPFEKDFHFHHGEPPILPSPTVFGHGPEGKVVVVAGSIQTDDDDVMERRKTPDEENHEGSVGAEEMMESSHDGDQDHGLEQDRRERRAGEDDDEDDDDGGGDGTLGEDPHDEVQWDEQVHEKRQGQGQEEKTSWNSFERRRYASANGALKDDNDDIHNDHNDKEGALCSAQCKAPRDFGTFQEQCGTWMGGMCMTTGLTARYS
ncbi:hypothetical protein EC968_010432 [Mortierella alpina]|nr:hypothetical protein EC968_010432 [Mortierella alpina]